MRYLSARTCTRDLVTLAAPAREREFVVSRSGDFYENRVTGEFVVVLRGDEDSAPHESAIAHLTVKPHGAVAGEHVHPQITERFAVISGTLATRLNGVERSLHAGEEATATAGVAHDWWNAGEDAGERACGGRGAAGAAASFRGDDRRRCSAWRMTAGRTRRACRDRSSWR